MMQLAMLRIAADHPCHWADMSYCVHLQVSFQAEHYGAIAPLARRHLLQLPPGAIDARWFLEDLGDRRGEIPGRNGGVCVWAMVGNHTDPALFVEELMPFWRDLLNTHLEGGPPSFGRVVFLYQGEQSAPTGAIEIGWDDEDDLHRQLVVRHCKDLPIAWERDPESAREQGSQWRDVSAGPVVHDSACRSDKRRPWWRFW